MKRLSEVSKMTGIPRSKLQRYASKGIANPIIDDVNGYWYYDQEAIERLYLACILNELDYSTEQIADFFTKERNNKEYIKYLDDTYSRLMKKQIEISGMIGWIFYFKVMAQFPEETLRLFNMATEAERTNFSNLKKQLSDEKKEIGESMMEGDNDPYQYDELSEDPAMVFFTMFVLLAKFINMGPDSKTTQSFIRTIYQYAIDNEMFDQNPEVDEKQNMQTFAQEVLEGLEDESLEIDARIREKFGNKGVTFVKEAMGLFGKC